MEEILGIQLVGLKVFQCHSGATWLSLTKTRLVDFCLDPGYVGDWVCGFFNHAY